MTDRVWNLAIPSTPCATGEAARLIEAEGALPGGDATSVLSKLIQLHVAVTGQGTAD